MKTVTIGIMSSVCVFALALLAGGPVWGGLILHLDASDPSTIEDSAGNKANEGGFVTNDVAKWYYKSGRNNHAIQGTAGDRPTFVSGGWPNGNDMLRFAELEHMEGFSVAGTAAGENPGMTVFIVVKSSGVDGEGGSVASYDTWLGNNGNGYVYINTKPCGSTPEGVPPDSNAFQLGRARYGLEMRATIPGGRTSHQMITAKYDASTGEAEILSDGGNMRCWWQGVEGQEQHSIWEVPVPPSANIGAGLSATFDQIGLYQGGGLAGMGLDGRGDLAEIMFYDEALSADEENAVGYALAQKWGLPTDQPVVRAALPGRDIARFEAAPDREYLFKGYYASTSPRAVVTVEWLNRDTMSLGALGKHLFKGYYAPNLSLDTFRESNISLSSFEIVLPETQGRRVEFFAEVRAPKSKRDLDVRVTISHDGDEELVRCDEISLRQGTIRDYIDACTLPTRPRDAVFPIIGWLTPDRDTLESITRQDMALNPNVTTDRLLAEYALANFSVGTPGTAEFGTLFIGTAWPEDERLVEVTKDPMFWGFPGGDEPMEDKFPGLAKINERIQRLAPGTIFWVNHLPTYMRPPGEEAEEEGWLHQYEKFIKLYIDMVKPKFFTYDHYCLTGSNWRGCFQTGDYFANLAIVRNLAQEAEIEFGVFVSVTAFLGVPSASESQLRWQAFTTLAYGSKALGWFTYMTEMEYSNMNWRDAVINRDGSRTRHYTMLKQLNGEILNWGPTLLGLTSTGAYHTEPLPLRTHPVSESKRVRSVTGGEAVIGEFEDKDQRRYLMVVNRDYNNAVSLLVKLRQGEGRVYELSKETGARHEATDYSPATGELNVQLAAGDARLFCLP